MPLVRISVHQHMDGSQRRRLADLTYQAMRSAFNIPEDDQFVVVTPHGPEELFINPTFMGVQRTDNFVLVNITLRRGRSVELKQNFYRTLVDLFQQNADVRPDDVMIVLTENDLPDWSFGRGEAQYVLHPPPGATPVK